MRPEDLLRLRWVADPQVHPDGRRIAFTLVAVDEAEDDYVSNIWLQEAAGGAARPLTGGRADGQPRWSPDGRQLAFLRKPAGEEPGAPQLHLLDLAGGEAVRLTQLSKGVSAPAWSPDGRRLAFLSRSPFPDAPAATPPPKAPGRIVTRPIWRMNGEGFIDWEQRDQIWLLDLDDGGPPRRLTDGPWAAGAPRWSANGQRLFYLGDPRPEPWFERGQNQLFSVEVLPASDAPVPASTCVADFGGSLGRFLELPDGSFAGLGQPAGDRIRSYDQPTLVCFGGPWPIGAARAPLTALDLDFGGGSVGSDQHPPRGGGSLPFAVAAEPGALLAVLGKEGAARLARLDPAAGTAQFLTGPDQEVYAGSISSDGRRAALALGEHEHPGRLFTLDLAGTGARPELLFDPNSAVLASARLGEVDTFWLPSFDGRPIQCWLFKPPEFDPGGRYPLILQIHGGPHTAYGVGFYHEFRVLAAAGYLVLACNPRGSTTYGQDFADCIQYAYPGDDAKDLLAVLDQVCHRPYVDSERLGVTGGSGGGLLTNWLVAHDGRFKAAISQRCVADWLGFFHSADFCMFSPFWFRDVAHRDPASYLDRSPFLLAEQVNTPLLLIHSEEDWRTPIGQSEAMFRALKAARKPVAMLRFPGENHELSRSGAPSRRVQNQEAILRWFDHWLKGVEAAEFGLPLPESAPS